MWICNDDGQSWREAFCGAESLCLDGQCAPSENQWVRVRAWEQLRERLPAPTGRVILSAAKKSKDLFHHPNGTTFRFSDDVELPVSDDPLRLVIRFRQPVGASERQRVEQIGGRIEWTYDRLTALVSIPASRFAQLCRSPFVGPLSPLAARDKATAHLLQARIRMGAVTSDGCVRLSFRFFADVKLETAQTLFAGFPTDSSEWDARQLLHVEMSPGAIEPVLASPLVWWVE